MTEVYSTNYQWYLFYKISARWNTNSMKLYMRGIKCNHHPWPFIEVKFLFKKSKKILILWGENALFNLSSHFRGYLYRFFTKIDPKQNNFLNPNSSQIFVQAHVWMETFQFWSFRRNIFVTECWLHLMAKLTSLRVLSERSIERRLNFKTFRKKIKTWNRSSFIFQRSSFNVVVIVVDEIIFEKYLKFLAGKVWSILCSFISV